MSALANRLGAGLVALLLAVLLLGAAYAVGHGRGMAAGSLAAQKPLLQELASVRETQLENERLAAKAQSRRLLEAYKKGDALQAGLRARERVDRLRTKERHDGLASKTVGMPCLGDGALRLLDGAPGLRVVRVPQAASGAAGADGAAATAASDRDLAGWALAAGEQYERCRGRLDAVRQWHEGENMKGPVQ